YALIYVGLGKNDPDNDKRIATAVKALPGTAHRALSNPKVNALPIVQDRETRLGTIGRNDWAKSKIRTASLEGTAVVRGWVTAGSPEEQVILINAIAREYVEHQQEFSRDRLKDLESDKNRFKVQQEQAGARVTEKDEREFRRQEEVLKHPPTSSNGLASRTS